MENDLEAVDHAAIGVAARAGTAILAGPGTNTAPAQVVIETRGCRGRIKGICSWSGRTSTKR